MAKINRIIRKYNEEMELLDLAIWRSMVSVAKEISLENPKSNTKLGANPNLNLNSNLIPNPNSMYL